MYWALGAAMLHADEMTALETEVDAEVAAAVAFAEAGSWEPAGNLLRDVHTPRPGA